VDLIVDDWSAVRPVAVGLAVAATLRKLYPDDWNPKNYDRLLVHKATYEGLLAGKSPAELEKGWAADLHRFRERRGAFLLYPE
jgi:hypothetical protein